MTNITVQLTDDTTTFDLVYDASTQPYYHSRKGLAVQTEDTDVLQHTPDASEPVPIRGVDRDRTLFLTADILGSSEDEVLDKLAAIKRMVDGAHQQALRYHTIGDVARVKVKMKRGTSDNYTYQIVKWGHVDDSGAHYTAAAQNSGYAIGILVTLHLTAYGEGAPITLRNDLPSSSHFLEDSNSDGVADGWTAINSPTSTALITTQYLIGGKSQQITTNNSTGQGIQSSTVTVTAGTACVAYIWIRAASTSDPITISFLDGSNVTIASATFTASNPTGYDKTAVGGGGNTWYRYSFSGTNTNANVKMSIIRASANASIISTFRVDAAYIQTGTSTIPDAWCSTSAIYNRNDPVTANPERINYVDVAFVPGDSDAVVKTSVTLGSVSRTTIMASRHSDGEILAANVDHWIESDELTTVSASGTWSTGTGTSDNHYQRFTEGGSPGANSRAYISLTGSSARALLKYPRRIFALARSSSTTSQFVGVVYAAGENTPLTDKTKTSDTGTGVATINTWELLDLGLINGYGLLPSSPPSDSDQEISLNIYVQAAPSSSTNDIDALLLPVVGDEFAIWVGKEETRSSGGEIIFDGTAKAVVSAASGIYEQPTGGLWYAAAGKMNRYVFAVVDSDNVFAIADTMSVSFTVYPRTRHLLGTS